MTRNLLHAAGKALYGPRWQVPLSRDLGVSDRTMRRWAAGGDIPDSVRGDLRALIEVRADDLDRLLRQLQPPAA